MVGMRRFGLRECCRGVVDGVVLVYVGEVEDRGTDGHGAAEEVFPYDDDGHSGRSYVLLGAAEDYAKLKRKFVVVGVSQGA